MKLGLAWRRLAIRLLVAGALAACSAPPPAATVTPAYAPDSLEALRAEIAALPPGDAAAGKGDFTAVGCVACHSLEKDVRIVGPSLAGVATRATTRKPGYTAQLYLYESITRPSAYVVAGFPNGLMPQDFKTRLRPKDLADLIAFLLTEQ